MKKLPRNFMMGTATAALQIEGGDTNNNWFRWCEEGKIENSDHCITACDHWNRIDEDTKLMEDLGVDTYRMGLEWSRIQPDEDRFDDEAIKKYRYEIELLLSKGIKPLVTLWHFSHPLWFEDNGGWTNADSIDNYLKFVEYTMNALGDVVSDWITFNEPNVYLTYSYFEGKWPPGEKGKIKLYIKAAAHIIEAHQRAYTLIHKIRKNSGHDDTIVGVAHHLRVFDLYKDTQLANFSRKLIERLFHDIFLEGMTTGVCKFPIRKLNARPVHRCADFLGINYYSRDLIKGKWAPSNLFSEVLIKENTERNDLNWEIYPDGIRRLSQKMYKKYKIPIFITENGTCDYKDEFREKYIRDHMTKVVEAIENGADIQRFYYWTLMDNFEWTEGYAPRFGLYDVDFNTQERTLRKSGEYFKSICTSREI